jgi:hypothetical protein
MEGLMKRLFYSFGFSVSIFLFMGLFSQARGDALGMFGASARSAAMGGAMVAIAEGPEAVYYNPSALGLSPNSSSFQSNYQDARLYVNGEDYGPGGMVGTYGFNQRFLRDRIALGILFPQVDLGLGGKDSELGGGTGYRLTGLGDTPYYGWPMYGNPIIPLYYGLSFRLHDTLAVAVSQSIFGYSYLRFSPVILDLDANLESLLGIALGGQFTDVNYNLHLGISWEPAEPGYSFTFRPLKYISFGYLHQGEAEMDLYVPLVLKSSLLEYDLVMILVYDVLDEPAVDRMGVGFHIPLPRSKLTLAYEQDAYLFGDLYEDRYDDWEHYTRNLSFASGDQSISYPKPSPQDNVIIDRYGLEYLLNMKGWLPDFLSKRNPELAVRGGFFHWESPYPDDILWGDSFDSVADAYSGGIGLSFYRKTKEQVKDPTKRRRVSIDFHFQYMALEDRDYTLEYNEWGEPVGPSQTYYYFTEGEVINCGLQLTWWH